MIDLHFWPTPNSKKVTILLEELLLHSRLRHCGQMLSGQSLWAVSPPETSLKLGEAGEQATRVLANRSLS